METFNFKSLNLKKIFTHLYKLKISDLLVEAGGILFADLIKNKLESAVGCMRADFFKFPLEFNRKSINSTLNVLVLKNGKKNRLCN